VKIKGARKEARKVRKKVTSQKKGVEGKRSEEWRRVVRSKTKKVVSEKTGAEKGVEQKTGCLGLEVMRGRRRGENKGSVKKGKEGEERRKEKEARRGVSEINVGEQEGEGEEQRRRVGWKVWQRRGGGEVRRRSRRGGRKEV
jgi:hypothetical protein